MKNKISAVFSFLGMAGFISFPIIGIFAVWLSDTPHIEFIKKLVISLFLFCILCAIVVRTIHYSEDKNKIDEIK